MKKVVLIHCYSDQNRGDSGIIESTIDMINDVEAGCEINAISVFHEKDERYRDDHYFTKKVVKGIYPALFHEPNIKNNGIDYSTAKKTVLFFLLLIKNILILAFPYRCLAKVLLTDEQLKTFDVLRDTDLVVSKGGSFLYSLKGLKGEFFLTRMLFAFLLPLRMGKKVCIFSQSIGPFENKLSKHLLFYVVKRLDRVYLREEKCIKFLPEKLRSLVTVIPDSAFYMTPVNCSFDISDNKKVAITARPHRFSNNKTEQHSKYSQYLDCLVEMAQHCLSAGYEVHLVGQVTGPSLDENDREALKLIFERIGSNTKDVYFWREAEGLMSPKELQYLYSKMDLVIGTRLHSAIFALAAGVPSINIAYHGTKSRGVMASVGLEKFVMDISDMNSVKGVAMIDEIVGWDECRAIIDRAVASHREKLKLSMTEFMAQ